MSTHTTEKLVTDLTVAELQELIRETVVEVVTEFIEDPDEGLELSDWAAARLAASREKAASGERETVPLSEVANRYRSDG